MIGQIILLRMIRTSEEFHGVISDNEVKEADETFTPDVYDTYLNMELAIPQTDSLEPRLARVTKND